MSQNQEKRTALELMNQTVQTFEEHFKNEGKFMSNFQYRVEEREDTVYFGFYLDLGGDNDYHSDLSAFVVPDDLFLNDDERATYIHDVATYFHNHFVLKQEGTNADV